MNKDYGLFLATALLEPARFLVTIGWQGARLKGFSK